MHYIYCPKCGAKLVPRPAGDDGDVPYCTTCEKYWFDNFQSSSVIMIYNEYDEIVLCRQKHISQDYATLNSGIILPGETAEETAVREIREELGIELDNLTPAGTSFYTRYDTLLHWFIAFVPKMALRPSSELQAAEWVPIADAPKIMLPDEPGNAVWGLYRVYLRMREAGELRAH